MRAFYETASILLALVVVTALSPWLTTGMPRLTVAAAPIGWTAFLYAIPVALAAVLVFGRRWALMGAVMYGTIGLALDLATVVQELGYGEGRPSVAVASAVTGLLNFLLILFGGRGFLGDRPSASA